MYLDRVGRLQAFGIHLAISFVIFLLLLYLIVFHWYPSFFLTLDGGYRGIATIFFVDVVLGPGLTLLVFKPGKPSLKFDMAVIVIIQLVALGWGITKVYEDRSATAVFYLGKFNCLGATNSQGISQDIVSGTISRQKLAFLQRPDTVAEYNAMLSDAIKAGGSEIYYYGSRFEPISAGNVDRIRSYRLTLDELIKDNLQAANLTMQYIENNDGYMESYGIYPLSCRFGDAMAVFDFNKLEITETFAKLDSRTIIRAESDIPMR